LDLVKCAPGAGDGQDRQGPTAVSGNTVALLVLKEIDEQANENGTGVNRPKNEYFVQKTKNTA
jgi:hypothetical protein